MPGYPGNVESVPEETEMSVIDRADERATAFSSRDWTE
jgi:hypothetical protein